MLTPTRALLLFVALLYALGGEHSPWGGLYDWADAHALPEPLTLFLAAVIVVVVLEPLRERRRRRKRSDVERNDRHHDAGGSA